ncbi:MAG: ATP-binding protein [Lysobacterales bacterium]
MTSLRRLLLVSLLLTIGSATALSTWFSYRDSLTEANELFDAKLSQSARVLRALAARSLADRQGVDPLLVRALDREMEGKGDELATADGHAYETKLAFQVVDANRVLLLRSDNAPEQPMAELRRGFGRTEIDGANWRTFALLTSSEQWYLVAEREDIRDELAREIAVGTALPALIALPVLALLVIAIVGWGSRAITRVAQEVERRPVDRLDRLDARQAPRELQGLVQALNRLFARVESALEREQRFTADAAHELRTPISALKLHAENLAASVDQEQRQTSLDGLMRGIRRCERLVAQLLDLARLERAGLRPELRAVDLASVLRGVIADLTPEAIARDVELVLEPGESAPVLGDPTLLAVLARNLIENAIRHGGSQSEVLVTLMRDGEAVALIVEDAGPGIPVEQRERVFARFHREADSGVPGSGLGLSIVSRVLELLQGSIQLGSGPQGKGLRVSVRLPAAVS